MKKEIDFKKIPYFDVKVVKVKGVEKKKCEHSVIYYKPGMIGYRCCKCGKNVDSNGKNKGNFVNGENLDKIKFPCLCSFLIFGKEVYGELDYVGHSRDLIYLKELVEQTRVNDERYYTQFPICNLDKMIKTKDIHILKGKIIIFEEVK